jgi:glycosyltransferase involved in cell wall biosynthesis
VRFLLQEADGVLVTTQALAQRLLELNQNIAVVPHALDEQLLVSRWVHGGTLPFGPRRKIVGYMGTLTHDDDLMMVLPALQTVRKRHGDEIEFQIVGGIGREGTLEALGELPVRVVNPGPAEIGYPLFMLWFTGHLRWDVAISPLMDTPFNRCKSDIKFLDYSAIGGAGIYSRVPAYESSVRHSQTGLLVDNDVGAWVEALETLLSDDGLRIELARNAIEYLYTQRILSCRAHDWPTALGKLLENA